MSGLLVGGDGRRGWARRAAGLAAMAWLGLVACSRTPEAALTPKPPAVTVVAAVQRPVPVYGQYVGQTEAVRTVEVRARVEGFLDRQVVPDGADVKAGDLLFVIDPRPFRVALNDARAQLARDEARLVNARQVAARYRPLYERQAVSRQELEQAEADERAAAATIEASRAAVEQAELNLGYTAVRSPVTGRMGRAEVRVGSLVGKGDATLLAAVSTLDPMYVNFSVSEREALQVWRRRQAELQARPGTSGVTITLPDDIVYPQDGRLDFVDRAVDSRTGTLALRATFPNPERLLRPGQYVRLQVLLEERPGALLVPQAAVQESQGSASLFVVGADGKVQARTVRMGPRLGTLWVVEDGVEPGEHVVVKGLQQIRAGMPVEPTLEAIPPERVAPEGTAQRPAGAARRRRLALAWNALLARLTAGYDRTVQTIVRRVALALVLLLILTGATWGLLRTVPTGFAPIEDQGYLLVNVQLPDAASLERTDAVVRQIEQIVLETEGVETVVAVGGQSLIAGVNGPNVATLFPRLAPWSQRERPELQADAVLARLRARLGGIQEAVVVVFPPPPIPGISFGGGFQFELQSVAGGSLEELDTVARQVIEAAGQRPELAAVYTAFRPGVPQLDAQVDRAKSKALGVPVSDVFESLQIFLGSLYVNDFNAFGRVWRVQLQAEPSSRATPSDIARLYVRSQPGQNGQPGQMVPLSTLVTVRPSTGPDTISHYNLYRSAQIAGATAPGASSGQAIDIMEELAGRFLPAGTAYEWTGLAFQEIEAGSWAPFVFVLSVLFVFLVLAAQYESWLVPLAVILAVPLGVLGALTALALRGLAIDVYAQIGLALLIGLAAKNAILIVEFARVRREHGLDMREAAREAARIRFRPILMTSFAFIMASLPLLVATGAGAASRHSIGTTVAGGMLAVTVLGVLLVPAFYVAVEWLAEWRRRASRGPAASPEEGADPPRTEATFPDERGAPPPAEAGRGGDDP